MTDRTLPYHLYFTPPDRERGVLLGRHLRGQGVGLSWEGDDQAQELGVNIQSPRADVHLFLWSHAAFQAGRWTGWPGREATPANYLVVRLDDEPLPGPWTRFHRAELGGWDGSADHAGLKALVEALRARDISRLPTGPTRSASDVPLSPSVSGVVRSLASQSSVTAWDIVKTMLAAHKEYGAGEAKRLAGRSGPAVGRAQPVQAWIGEVQSLFGAARPDTVHGRLLVLGLARVDENLGKYLAAAGFLEALQKEMREPVETWFAAAGAPSAPSDSAPLHIDSPAVQDRLGRQAFARTLAARLSRIWSEYRDFGQTSFILHLHGPWGTGKTTLLNLLREELLKPSGDRVSNWIVVEFNAWQHQGLDPPWWPLLNTVYLHSREQVRERAGWRRALRLRSAEWWWRFYTGRKDIFFAALFFLGLAALVYFPMRTGLSDSASVWLEKLSANAGAISGILALIGTLLSVSLVMTRSLSPGSVSTARAFVEHASDPMHWVQRHFGRLCTAIDLPIAIFIDDLDRCRREYVVSLLEGIQTLFRNPRVVYVVAADRRWLHTCFEKTYTEFSGTVHEPGRALGSLFLEKAVQLSVSVPRLSEEVRRTYWDYLLRTREVAPAQYEALRESERQRFADAKTQEAVFSMMSETGPDTGDPLRLQVRREMAVEKLGTAPVEESTEFFLSPFAPLLDPNPRSMKRFVNAYALQRDLAVLAGLDIVDQTRRKQLALWTIVCLRWPQLEEYLLELAFDKTREPKAETRALLETESVKSVLAGKGVDAGLTLETLVQFAGLRASESTAGTVA
jgi:hypothetical protein